MKRKLRRFSPPKLFASRAAKAIIKRRLVDTLGGKCIDCGYNAHLCALDFDHVDRKRKVVNVSKLINVGIYELALAEARKCVIRCANCHRIKTQNENNA